MTWCIPGHLSKKLRRLPGSVTITFRRRASQLIDTIDEDSNLKREEKNMKRRECQRPDYSGLTRKAREKSRADVLDVQPRPGSRQLDLSICQKFLPSLVNMWPSFSVTVLVVIGRILYLAWDTPVHIGLTTSVKRTRATFREIGVLDY
jgi:hypothetical protein